ncbi:MAG: hypothetical protein RR255_04680 [Bacilli bacterium]
MKRILDNKYFRLFLLLISLGIFLGLVYFFLLSKMDKLYIKDNLNTYYTSSKIINYKDFIYNIFNSLIILSVIWCSSIIILFVPIICFINIFIGFKISFLLINLIYSFKLKGLYYFLITLLPLYILKVLILTLFIILAYKYSYKIYAYFKGKININIKLFAVSYFKIYMIFIVLLVVYNIIECLVMPYIFKIFI